MLGQNENNCTLFLLEFHDGDDFLTEVTVIILGGVEPAIELTDYL